MPPDVRVNCGIGQLEAINQTKVNMTVWLGNYPIPTDPAPYSRQRDAIVDALKKYVEVWKDATSKEKEKTEVMTVLQLTERMGRKVAGINLLEIEAYLKRSKVSNLLQYTNEETFNFKILGGAKDGWIFGQASRERSWYGWFK